MPERPNCLSWTARPVLPVVLAACGSGAPSDGAPETKARSVENTSVDPAPTGSTAALECGQPFQPPAKGLLTLTGRFPATAVPGAETLTGTIDVTGRDAVQGVVAPRADVFLVRDGRIATLPLVQDSMGVLWNLAPGQTEHIPGDAALISCESGVALAPGTYELFVRVVLAPDSGGPVESFGGPWPLEVQ